MLPLGGRPGREREFFIDNLPVRIHFIIMMIRWSDLAPWEFEFSFPGPAGVLAVVGYHDVDHQMTLTITLTIKCPSSAGPAGVLLLLLYSRYRS